MTFIKENETYISVGRDGVVCAWTRTMLKHCATMKTGSMATNVVFMAGMRKLVVANADYTMSFYDASTFKLDKKLPLATLPLCVCSWTIKGQDFLAYGDEHGKVHIFSHKKLELHLHKNHATGGGHWVTKVEYNHDLNALISASSDGAYPTHDALISTIMLLSTDDTAVRRYGEDHGGAQQGTDQDHAQKPPPRCHILRVVLVYGRARHLRPGATAERVQSGVPGTDFQAVWPHGPGNGGGIWWAVPVYLLRCRAGAHFIIRHLSDTSDLVMTPSGMQVIKVWDVRTMSCIQTISSFKHDAHLHAFSICFDEGDEHAQASDSHLTPTRHQSELIHPCICGRILLTECTTLPESHRTSDSHRTAI